MVTTRSQSYRIKEVDNSAMDRSSDNEIEASFLDILSRDQMTELDTEDLLNRQRNTDGYSIDQRFNEINIQIGDLTNIVLTLTQQFFSNNREGNRLNVATTSANSRSDRLSRPYVRRTPAIDNLTRLFFRGGTNFVCAMGCCPVSMDHIA